MNVRGTRKTHFPGLAKTLRMRTAKLQVLLRISGFLLTQCLSTNLFNFKPPLRL